MPTVLIGPSINYPPGCGLIRDHTTGEFFSVGHRIVAGRCSILNRMGMEADCQIERMVDSDWPAVRRIYADGIATGNATFETEGPDWETWDRNHLDECRLVVRSGEAVVAWAALSPVSARQCYAGVAEHSIYVDQIARGKGIGKRLLTALVSASEALGYWTLQSSVFPENAPSIAIHLACGFRILGRRKRVAQLNGVWRDTVIVERRSTVVDP